MKQNRLQIRFCFSLKTSFAFLVLFASFQSSAQMDIDSLRLAYDYADVMGERISTQILIGEYYDDIHEYDRAIIEFHRAIEMIPNDQSSLRATTVEKLGNSYKSNEEISKAKEAFQAANDLYQLINSSAELIGRNYSLIGRCYYDEADYDSAMVYYLKAEEVYETSEVTNRPRGILYHFIGSVFKRQDDYDKACEYYQKEIDYGIKYEYKDVEAEGRYLSSICLESDSARLKNNLACMKMYEDLNMERLVGLMAQNAAENYLALGYPDSALVLQKQSLEVRRRQNEVSHLAGILSGLSKTYIQLGDYKKAEEHLEEAEQIALETGIKKYIRLEEIYGIYYDMSMNKNDYKSAIQYLKLEYSYKDSAMNTSHKDAIAEMEVRYDSEKQAAQMALLQKDKDIIEKEKLLSDEAAEAQSFYTVLLLIGGIILLIAGVFVYFKYRESQKQKSLISNQKTKMQLQKEQVEAKNKDITDSMIYASTIQKAIITSENYINRLFSDFFVFYEPRDIVSGDFYWAYETNTGQKLIAVGDCTGHGVPGAMMSMLGNSFLNEIIIEGGETQPNIILEKLRSQVKKALPASESRDGMDMSICLIDKGKLKFAGANLPIYLIKGENFEEIKGNKQPVGYTPTEEIPFTQTDHELSKGDVIYLFSDGYADQFGGTKGKKYKYKTLREKLVQISKLPLSEQKKIIIDEFHQWKGDLEQLDDVCLLGIKI
ncbi:MAG: hypothetical protein BM555_00295 [Crocinitomix sp. MedPE-SWsnd]|nr:MAG: hypothetical protein BM555_00295 [Crocinitomix sp. MedPE-SWsnd]